MYLSNGGGGRGAGHSFKGYLNVTAGLGMYIVYIVHIYIKDI